MDNTCKRKCLARLTNWERTNSPIGVSNKRASIVRLCKNTPVEGFLCEECKGRPVGGKYQTRMMHGLLDEGPPEDSHVYGSKWYWQQVAKYGDPLDKSWLAAASAAQEEAEKLCEEYGMEAWLVQRPGDDKIEEMKRTKQRPSGAGAAAVAAHSKPATAAVMGSIKQAFPPIKVLYEEDNTPPLKVMSDTLQICKKEIKGKMYWVTESGRKFECDEKGEIGEPAGRV